MVGKSILRISLKQSKCLICDKKISHARTITKELKNDPVLSDYFFMDTKHELKKIVQSFNQLNKSLTKILEVESFQVSHTSHFTNKCRQDALRAAEDKDKISAYTKEFEKMKTQMNIMYSKMQSQEKKLLAQYEELKRISNDENKKSKTLLTEQDRQIKRLTDELVFLRNENQQYKGLMSGVFTRLSPEAAAVVKEKFKQKLTPNQQKQSSRSQKTPSSDQVGAESALGLSRRMTPRNSPFGVIMDTKDPITGFGALGGGDGSKHSETLPYRTPSRIGFQFNPSSSTNYQKGN
ncbi:DgyrCDS7566 [Dimorphilus gyrociliatus]|uniref:DgyrCDS7566 n=1 Tax=Dimorphilus gyrociliatus TaxID=2664684 RepID=A0A7I8VWC7_9ANNE|nr:DgyrCDS7566 [Dimorphilus gyrociliatus]